MSISVKYEVPQGMQTKFNKMLADELKKAEKQIGKLLVSYAKNNHRFESRTGRLEGAIKIRGNLNTGLEVYIDLNQADYGRYIVKGQRTWKADKFMEQALSNNESQIQEIMERAVNDAVLRFNRS